MVRQVLLAAVVAGAAAGAALTALQSAAVSPLLLAAESYEAGVGDPAPASHRHGGLTHSHAFGGGAHEHDGHALVLGNEEEAAAPGAAEGRGRSSAPAAADHGHGAAPPAQEPVSENHHEHEDGHHHGGAWASEDGIGRTFRTALSNVATAIGFALLLVAVFAWRGGATTWRRGLLWGAAGFFVFFVNPAIGLRPAVPGAFEAGLLDRQLWWLLAVGCSAAGAGLLLLAPRAAAKVGGAALLAAPHLVGAPHPEGSGGLAPSSLADAFVVASAATNAAFWIVLGVVAALTFGRLSRASPPSRASRLARS